MCCVSLVSIRRSHLWDGQLPVRLRGAERGGPVSVSVAGAAAGSGWKDLRGYVPVFMRHRRPDGRASRCLSHPRAARVETSVLFMGFFMCSSQPFNLLSDNQIQLFWQRKKDNLAAKMQFGNSDKNLSASEAEIHPKYLPIRLFLL